MKVGAFLDAWRSLPACSPAAFLDGRPLLVLSPHPDDESLGLGGLIAAACAMGVPVDIVTITDGAGSHPRSELYPRDRLIALRKAESAAAAAALGLSSARLHHLDLPDTQAPRRGPAFDDAVDRLGALVERTGARTVMVTWGGDPHCDHEAADAMARALRRRDPAMELWSYPIWGWHRDPDEKVDDPAPSGWQIDIEPWLPAKRAAIAAHASQMTDLIPDDPEGFRFTPATLAPFLRPVETLFKVPA